MPETEIGTSLQRTKLAHGLLDAFDTGNYDAFLLTLASSAKWEVLPLSLGFAPLSLRETAEYLRGPRTNEFSDGRLHDHILETIDAGTHFILRAKPFKTVGKNNKPFDNEFLYIFTFTLENGEAKIQRVQEWVDSAFVAYFIPSAIRSTSASWYADLGVKTQQAPESLEINVLNPEQKQHA
ncbi:hypothetical protein BKA62DRAFT_833668 [Auriculariales sp. MPI-PUGE-AT-0066]|nr:hypothetical protein BKA62DRAFT_833668 [Auriculariales sp. MPI-PUGE-AT-0066]